MALQRFPGFIDVHVHLRDPGATHKEDFRTGSRAALAGGFTYVIDMPNNPTPTVSIERLEEKITLAHEKALCDIGFHYGTDGHNTDSFAAAAASPLVFGLKIYCNHTTGNMLLQDLALLEKIFQAWPKTKPILVHAEGMELAATIGLARLYDQRLHVCHITQAIEVELVRRAKQTKQAITAGVCPHHLYLTEQNVAKLKGYGIMKPPLGTTDDQDALWEGLADGTIDIVETDHAPHSKEEKEAKVPAFGVTGLETAVGLVCKGMADGRLKPSALAQLLHHGPRKIFNIPEQSNTYVELDPTKAYKITKPFETKCGWSPFEGREAYGQVQTVVLRGVTKVAKGKVTGA